MGVGPEAAIDDARYRDRLASLVDDLAAILEAVDDLALEVLREAAEAGMTSRPPLERLLTRVRGGLERSRHLLAEGADPTAKAPRAAP